MKYLIAGLGNIGPEYAGTRHNIGFDVLDVLAQKYEANFKTDRLAYYTEIGIRGRKVHLIKPTTYMNLSGKSLQYWLKHLSVTTDNVLVVTDDLSLKIGVLRSRGKGSAGGHNGLRNIEDVLGTQEYPRLRFGIGNDFPKGKQVDFVLGKWTEDERILVDQSINRCVQAIESFVTAGINTMMNQFNG